MSKKNRALGEKPERHYGESGAGYVKVEGGWQVPTILADRLGVDDEAATKALIAGVVDPLYAILRKIYQRRAAALETIRRDLNIPPGTAIDVVSGVVKTKGD